MSTTTSDFDLLDNHIGMSRTWQAFFAKDTREVDVTPPLALGVDIVSVGTAAFFDAEIHDVFNFLQQFD